MSWIAVAIGGAGVVGAGASMYNASKTPQMQTGYDIYKPETFAGYENLQGTNIGYLTEVLDQIKRGETPAYLQNMGTAMKNRRQKSLYEQYFGIPGSRTGMVQAAQEAGSIGGAGPKGQQAQVNKQLYNFNSQTAGIDDYIDEILGNYTASAATTFPQLASTQSATMPYQVISYGGQSSGGSGVGTGIANLGSSLGNALAYYGMSNTGNGAGAGNALPSNVIPGQGGYGLNAPSGIYNTGDFSAFPMQIPQAKVPTVKLTGGF